MKTKLSSTAFLLITLLILPTLTVVASAQGANLEKAIASNISAATQNFDSRKALSLAMDSSGFKEKTVGLGVQFNSIFDTWTFDSSGTVTWDTVNVVFSGTETNGSAVNVVVTEDPGLLSVVAVTTQHVALHATTSTNWSGYTFTGNAGGTAPVYEAYSSWTEPAVSEPQAYWCFFAHCDFAIWPGLTATSLGSTGIVQAGSNSGLYCTAGCSYYYYGWYEFYPAALVQCNNFPVSPGDSMAADIINHARTGGSSTLYDIYVYDFTSGRTCSVTNQSFTNFNTPYYGQFIGERLQWSDGSYSRLPKFGSVTMSGSIYYGGALQGIYNPYSNGWYTQVIMTNGGNTNIQVGSVSSSSAFTQTWLTSAGT